MQQHCFHATVVTSGNVKVKKYVRRGNKINATLNGITHWKNYSWRAHVRVGGAQGDPEGDGRRALANGWESRLWRLEDKHLREGSSVRQFGRPRPLRIRHRRRRHKYFDLLFLLQFIFFEFTTRSHCFQTMYLFHHETIRKNPST